MGSLYLRLQQAAAGAQASSEVGVQRATAPSLDCNPGMNPVLWYRLVGLWIGLGSFMELRGESGLRVVRR